MAMNVGIMHLLVLQMPKQRSNTDGVEAKRGEGTTESCSTWCTASGLNFLYFVLCKCTESSDVVVASVVLLHHLHTQENGEKKVFSSCFEQKR